MGVPEVRTGVSGTTTSLALRVLLAGVSTSSFELWEAVSLDGVLVGVLRVGVLAALAGEDMMCEF